MPSTYTPIATQTLGSSAATVTFSSIPATYTDLIIIINGNVSNDTNAYMRFNGDSSSLYSFTELYGNGSSAGSGRDTNNTRVGIGNLYTGAINTTIINLQNYANTTTNKTCLTRENSSSNLVLASVGLYRSTSAISSIVFSLLSTFTFSAGSTFTLYGVKAFA